MNDLVIAVPATYGIATMIANYSGAFNMFERLRRLGKAFECSICLTPYVAVPISIGLGLTFFEYLASIGIVMFIERFYDRLF